MTRKEHTSNMSLLVEQWHQSGMTQTDFARAQNLTVVKLRYWIRKQRQAEEGSAFIQLNKLLPQSISIRYPNGVELSLPVQTPTAILQSLINL